MMSGFAQQRNACLGLKLIMGYSEQRAVWTGQLARCAAVTNIMRANARRTETTSIHESRCLPPSLLATLSIQHLLLNRPGYLGGYSEPQVA